MTINPDLQQRLIRVLAVAAAVLVVAGVVVLVRDEGGPSGRGTRAAPTKPPMPPDLLDRPPRFDDAVGRLAAAGGGDDDAIARLAEACQGDAPALAAVPPDWVRYEPMFPDALPLVVPHPPHWHVVESADDFRLVGVGGVAVHVGGLVVGALPVPLIVILQRTVGAMPESWRVEEAVPVVAEGASGCRLRLVAEGQRLELVAVHSGDLLLFTVVEVPRGAPAAAAQEATLIATHVREAG